MLRTLFPEETGLKTYYAPSVFCSTSSSGFHGPAIFVSSPERMYPVGCREATFFLILHHFQLTCPAQIFLHSSLPLI